MKSTILVINKKESATLVLHMLIMRKNYRKLVKKRYKARREDLNSSYDYILESAKDTSESENEENEVYLDEIDLEVLFAFLESYLNELYELDLKGEMLEQLNTVQTLYHRCAELMAA